MGNSKRVTITCRNCGNFYQTNGLPDGRPWGVINVSISVPAFLSKSARPHIFLGVFCDTKCLSEFMPNLGSMEAEFLEAFRPTELTKAGSHGEETP